MPASDGNMGWLILVFSVLSGWALLRVLGGERERLMQEIDVQIAEARIAAKRAIAAQISASAPAKPAGKKRAAPAAARNPAR